MKEILNRYNSYYHSNTSLGDYYPFGMLIKERSFSSAAYKYGFNGKEKDNEINVDGGDYDYGARIYDGRLGRWLSLDPYSEKYPFLSPYNYVGNMPIIAIDPDGKKIKIISTDPEFRQKAFADLQKLTSTQLVLLKNGQVIEASKANIMPESFIEIVGQVTQTIDKEGNEIPKTFGTDLVSTLINKDKTLSIFDSKDCPLAGERGANTTIPAHFDLFKTYDRSNFSQSKQLLDKYHMGEGTDAEVYYNPDNGAGLAGYLAEYYLMNQDGTYGREPQVGLGHELGHGLEMINGTQIMGKSDYVQPENCQVLSKEEIKGRSKYEKPIRNEQNQPERAEPTK